MRPRRKDRFSKEGERGGYILSSKATRPLPAWMHDPELLPKKPPRPRTQDEEDACEPKSPSTN